MAKYVIDGETLQGLANALRSVTGEDRKYTPTEMIEAVATILESGAYILVDAEGNEVPAVFVENETTFTATANDIRLGTTAVTDSGVTEGTKDIPAYHTTEGVAAVPAGSEFDIWIPESDRYDFTKLQAIICPFNQTPDKSVAAEKVSVNGNVYAAGSAEVIATVTLDHTSKKIKLGITNNSATPFVIRYFTYKEEY